MRAQQRMLQLKLATGIWQLGQVELKWKNLKSYTKPHTSPSSKSEHGQASNLCQAEEVTKKKEIYKDKGRL